MVRHSVKPTTSPLLRDTDFWESVKVITAGIVSKGWRIPRHFRHYHEFWFVTKGRLQGSIGARQVEANPDDLVYNDSWEGEDIELAFPSSILYVTFVCRCRRTGQLLPRTHSHAQALRSLPLIVTCANGEALTSLLTRIFSEVRACRPFWEEMALLHLRQLMILRERAALICPAAIANPGMNRAQRILEQTAAYVEEHLHERLAVRDLAARANLSRRHFIRLFMTISGVSPKVYITRARVERARRLLDDQSLAIKRIAHDSGFADPHYFCRLFKQHVGQSPSRFRAAR